MSSLSKQRNLMTGVAREQASICKEVFHPLPRSRRLAAYHPRPRAAQFHETNFIQTAAEAIDLIEQITTPISASISSEGDELREKTFPELSVHRAATSRMFK